MREIINTAVKDAMRSKDKLRLSTLRLVNAAIKDKDIALRTEDRPDGVSSSEILQILGKMVKQRQEKVDWKKLGYELEVSLRITLDKTQSDAFEVFISRARLISEVNEIQTFLGRVDVRLNILARDLAHYQSIYREQILNLPYIAEVEALMLISNIKRSDVLPI